MSACYAGLVLLITFSSPIFSGLSIRSTVQSRTIKWNKKHRQSSSWLRTSSLVGRSHFKYLQMVENLVLVSFFARPEYEQLPREARISFASYVSACYAGLVLLITFSSPIFSGLSIRSMLQSRTTKWNKKHRQSSSWLRTSSLVGIHFKYLQMVENPVFVCF